MRGPGASFRRPARPAMRPLAVVLLALALPAAAQSPEDARATLAECLEVRAAEDV